MHTLRHTHDVAGTELRIQEGYVLIIHKAICDLKVQVSLDEKNVTYYCWTCFTPSKAKDDNWMRHSGKICEKISWYEDDLARAIKNSAAILEKVDYKTAEFETFRANILPLWSTFLSWKEGGALYGCREICCPIGKLIRHHVWNQS